MKHILKGFDHARVFAYAALEYHRGGDLFPLTYIVEIIGRNCVADACDNILPRMSHLDFVYEIGLRKYGAAGSDGGGMHGLQRVFSDVLHFNTEAARLTGEKSAGSGSA